MYNKNMNSECNKCNSHTNSKPAIDGCCVPGIRSTLKVIKDCVTSTGNIPGFGVPVVITLSNGIEYTLNINTGTLNTLEIHNNILKYGNIQISLCDIAKTEILTSQINNIEFVNCLTNKLIQITKPHCPTSHCDYMAMSMDDDCNSCQKSSNNYYKKITPSQGNSSSSCSKCSANNKSECSCKKELSCKLNNDKDQIKSISFNGANASNGTVASIDSISKTNVISSATLSNSSDTFLKSISLQTNTTTVANNINLISSTVVNSIITTPTTIITGVVSTSTTVLSNIGITPISIVSAVSLQPPINVISNITENTIPVSGPVEITPQSIVNSISSNLATVVTSVSPNLATVVTAYSPTSDKFVSGITDINTVSTTSQNIPVFASSIASGIMQIVILADSLGASIPATNVTIPVYIGSSAVGTISVSSLNLFTSPVTVANIVGTPTISTALTGLGSPTSIPVVASIDTSSIATNLISSVSIGNINAVTNAPTTIALSSLSKTTTIVNGVNSVSQLSINNIVSTSTIPVITAITPSTISTLIINQINSSTISSVGSFSTTQAVNQITPNTTSSSALTNATLNITQTSVVNNIKVTDVPILSPSTELINGVILAIGCGIMVVRNNNGNISVYSLCEINAFTTLN